MRYGNPSKKDRTLTSVRGHSIHFPGRGTIEKSKVPPADPKHKDRATFVDEDGIVFVFVPGAVHAEAEAMGMQAESEREEKDEPVGKLKPEDSGELKSAAFKAFAKMVNAADRESFAANGFPKLPAVEKALGYSLTTVELKDLWTQYQLDRAGE